MKTKQLRDSSHTLLGFAVSYSIGSLTGFDTFPLYQKIIFAPITGGIIGYCLGFWIEWFQVSTNSASWDWKDVFRTAVGGVLGIIMSSFAPNEWFMVTILSILPIYFVISDLIKLKNRD